MIEETQEQKEQREKAQKADKELSRKIQAFKLSEYYPLLMKKLAIDYKSGINNLIVKDSPEMRGAVHYMLRLYDWFQSNSELEELINIENRKIEDDRDW